jgi:hypothetical protein
MICVLFSGFLGRVPCCATRISTSVTFRISCGSPIKELLPYKQKQPNAIAYPALDDGACAHNEVKPKLSEVRFWAKRSVPRWIISTSTSVNHEDLRNTKV